MPIKGLAKSDTHRFFANALAYYELHPLLEEYAREAMVEFEWYEDTEDEKSVMPSSYTVFGLGLSSERYFPLVEAYMDLVDDEHQLMHDKFTAVFADTYGITERSTPTLTFCLLRSHDSLKLKIQPELETEDKLSLFVQHIETLSDGEAERVLYPIWGKAEKLAAMARKAQEPRKDLLLRLLKATGIACRRFVESCIISMLLRDKATKRQSNDLCLIESRGRTCTYVLRAAHPEGKINYRLVGFWALH